MDEAQIKEMVRALWRHRRGQRTIVLRTSVIVLRSGAELRDAGFVNIRVAAKPESRELIRGWAPGLGIENHVVSATIEVRKPSA